MPISHQKDAVLRQSRCEAAAGFTIEAVENLVTSVVSSMLGETDIGSDTPLMDAGVDSLSAAELVQRLRTEFSTELPATTLFDYPSIVSIADHLTPKPQFLVAQDMRETG